MKLQSITFLNPIQVADSSIPIKNFSDVAWDIEELDSGHIKLTHRASGRVEHGGFANIGSFRYAAEMPVVAKKAAKR